MLSLPRYIMLGSSKAAKEVTLNSGHSLRGWVSSSASKTAGKSASVHATKIAKISGSVNTP